MNQRPVEPSAAWRDKSFEPRDLYLSARVLSIVTLVTVAVLGGCGADDDTAPDGGGADAPAIVATTTIVGDIVSNVVGGCATVEVLMGAGIDPHEFEASARQAASLRDADLVVTNGLGLEETLLPVLESAEAEGATVLALADGVDTIPFGVDQRTGDGDEHEDAAGSPDPHIWQDPSRIADAVIVLAEEFAADLDCDAEDLAERAHAYAEALREVDEQSAARFATIPDDRRTLVTNHDAFGYLADRYDFDIIGTVIPSGTTLAEPSSADLGELVEVLRGAGVRAIFAETTQTSDLADSLAAELGEDVEIVELYSDSLGDAASYIELLQTNATRITDALAS
jgi:zinc/manganese transport system substrate-binding protein